MSIAVGFDFDHTLGVDNKLERTVALEMLAELAANTNLTVDGTAASAAIEDVLHSYRRGTISVEDGIAGFFEAFVPGESTKALDAASQYRDRVSAAALECVEPLPGALEMLARLDDLGIKYAILTNGWSPLQEAKARQIAFKGPVFVSERIGARKPSREAFDVLVKHFDLPAEDVYYVGDDPEADCAGAAACGLRAVWFDWEGRPYPADIAQPAYRITALEELPALLQGHGSETANHA